MINYIVLLVTQSFCHSFSYPSLVLIHNTYWVLRNTQNKTLYFSIVQSIFPRSFNTNLDIDEMYLSCSTTILPTPTLCFFCIIPTVLYLTIWLVNSSLILCKYKGWTLDASHLLLTYHATMICLPLCTCLSIVRSFLYCQIWMPFLVFTCSIDTNLSNFSKRHFGNHHMWVLNGL